MTLSGFAALTLYTHRDAGDEEPDLVGAGGHILVEPAEEVCVAARSGRGADASHADFVGDEDILRVGRGEGVKLPLQPRERNIDVLPLGEEDIGGEEREAVDEHRAPRHVVAGDEEGLLDGGPRRAAAFLMAPHTVGHLLIEGLGRGEVDGIGREAQGKGLGESAFAGAGAAGHKYDAFHN